MAATELDRIGRRQHGLITREQALTALSGNRFEHLLQTSRLISVHAGVYRMSGAPVTIEQGILGAVLASPEGAAASHSSASYLHGLSAEPEHAHITVDRECSNKRTTMVVHRSPLNGSHVTTIKGIRVTTIERTVVDCASVLTFGALARMMDEAVISGRTTFQRIASVLVEVGSKGRKGSKNLRVLLGERVDLPTGSESGIELKVLRAARQARLPRPVAQHYVRVGRRRCFLDAAWPEHKVGVESDGFSVHGSSKKRFDDDRQRNNALALAGWTILHFTARNSTAEIAETLRRVIPSRT